jgi:hypothetical protein
VTREATSVNREVERSSLRLLSSTSVGRILQGQACTTGSFSNYNAQGGPFDVRVCRGTSTTDCTGWVVHSGF